MFRFEPPALGVVRGLFAVYALIGLVIYGMALLAEAIVSADEIAEGRSVQRSLTPSYGEGDLALRVIAVRTYAGVFQSE